jgi:hypothetical protein
MKHQFISVCLLLSTSLVGAQNLKTFNGEFENGEITKAKATYSYYEDSKTLEYLKQGAFKYVNSFTSDKGTFNATFNGNFKANKRDGIWTFVINEVDCPHTDNLYYTGSSKLTANYINGVPNGAWTYVSQYKRREKKWDGTWGSFEIQPNENVSATFKNGHFSGLLSISNNPSFAEFPVITGQYDDNGNPIGKWVLRNSETEKTIQFQDGVVTQVVVREITSGKVVDKIIDDAEMTKIKTDFIQKKLTKSDLVSMKIKVDTIPFVKEAQGMLWFGQSFNDERFKDRYIGGDITHYYVEFDNSKNDYNQKTGWFDTRNYGSYILFERAKQIKLSDLSAYKSALEKSKDEDAIEELNNILTDYASNLSAEDKEIVKQKIKERQQAAKQYENAQAAKNKYYALSSKIDDELSGIRYENLDIAPTTYFGYQASSDFSISLCRSIKEHSSNCYKIKEKLTNKNAGSNWSENYTTLLLNYNMFKPLRDSIIKMNESCKSIMANETKINTNYLDNGNKKKIYAAFIEVRTSLISRLTTSSDLKTDFQLISTMEKIYNNMIKMISNDLEIEKLIKKASTIEEKEKLLAQ